MFKLTGSCKIPGFFAKYFLLAENGNKNLIYVRDMHFGCLESAVAW